MEDLMGVTHSNGNGMVERPAPAGSSAPRCPRRLVLLQGGEDSAVEQVLAEYQGAEVSGKRLHENLQRLAGAHPGRCLAAEWLGPPGWARVLWGPPGAGWG